VQGPRYAAGMTVETCPGFPGLQASAGPVAGIRRWAARAAEVLRAALWTGMAVSRTLHCGCPYFPHDCPCFPPCYCGCPCFLPCYCGCPCFQCRYEHPCRHHDCCDFPCCCWAGIETSSSADQTSAVESAVAARSAGGRLSAGPAAAAGWATCRSSCYHWSCYQTWTTEDLVPVISSACSFLYSFDHTAAAAPAGVVAAAAPADVVAAV